MGCMYPLCIDICIYLFSDPYARRSIFFLHFLKNKKRNGHYSPSRAWPDPLIHKKKKEKEDGKEIEP
jgi:hypothetical protein